MSGKILSDEERWKIVQKIHYEYNQEVKKMIPLSEEEMQKIAKEVHEDFERILEKVAKDSEYLNRLAHERAIAKIKQEKEEAELLRSMKPSVTDWLLGLFKRNKNNE